MEGSMPLFGSSSVLCSCGSKSTPWSGTGMAGVSVSMAGECCMLAASRVVGSGGDGKVSNLVFSCMARQLTLGSHSSMQGPMSPSTLMVFPVVPSSSTSSRQSSSASIKASGPIPSRCVDAFKLISSSIESSSK